MVSRCFVCNKQVTRCVGRVHRKAGAGQPQRQQPARHLAIVPVVLPRARCLLHGDDFADPHAGGRDHHGQISPGAPCEIHHNVQHGGTQPRCHTVAAQHAGKGPQVDAHQAPDDLGFHGRCAYKCAAACGFDATNKPPNPQVQHRARRVPTRQRYESFRAIVSSSQKPGSINPAHFSNTVHTDSSNFFACIAPSPPPPPGAVSAPTPRLAS